MRPTKPYTRLEWAYFCALLMFLLLTGALAAAGELWAITDSFLILVLMAQAHSDIGQRQHIAMLQHHSRRLSEAYVAMDETLRSLRSSGEYSPVSTGDRKVVHLVSEDWREDGILAKTQCCGRYLSHLDSVAFTTERDSCTCKS